jgi:hypothetical protein
MLMLNSTHLNDCTACANIHVDFIRDLSKVKPWDRKCKAENLLKRWVVLSLMSHSLSFTCNSSCNTVNGEVQKKVGNFLSHCPTIMDHGSHHNLFQCSWTSDFGTWYRIHRAQYSCILSLVVLDNLLSFFPLSIQNLKTFWVTGSVSLVITADSGFMKSESMVRIRLIFICKILWNSTIFIERMNDRNVFTHCVLPVTLFLHNTSPFGRPNLLIAFHVKVNFSSCHVTAVLFETFFFPTAVCITDVPLPSKSSKLLPKIVTYLLYAHVRYYGLS